MARGGGRAAGPDAIFLRIFDTFFIIITAICLKRDLDLAVRHAIVFTHSDKLILCGGLDAVGSKAEHGHQHAKRDCCNAPGDNPGRVRNAL